MCLYLDIGVLSVSYLSSLKEPLKLVLQIRIAILSIKQDSGGFGMNVCAFVKIAWNKKPY